MPRSRKSARDIFLSSEIIKKPKISTLTTEKEFQLRNLFKKMPAVILGPEFPGRSTGSMVKVLWIMKILWNGGGGPYVPRIYLSFVETSIPHVPKTHRIAQRSVSVSHDGTADVASCPFGLRFIWFPSSIPKRSDLKLRRRFYRTSHFCTTNLGIW